MSDNRSVLSQIKNPWADEVILNQFDLEDDVLLALSNNEVREAKVIKISLNPKADKEVPIPLRTIVPAYLLRYKDDSGNVCEFWHSENVLSAVPDNPSITD